MRRASGSAATILDPLTRSMYVQVLQHPTALIIIINSHSVLYYIIIIIISTVLQYIYRQHPHSLVEVVVVHSYRMHLISSRMHLTFAACYVCVPAWARSRSAQSSHSPDHSRFMLMSSCSGLQLINRLSLLHLLSDLDQHRRNDPRARRLDI